MVKSLSMPGFPRWLVLLAAGLLLGAAAVVVAQIERGDRGIAPINSSNDLLVTDISVDVAGSSAEDARSKGWQEAQRKGWIALFKQVNGGTAAPGLPDSTLNGIVSAIVIQQEAIGPRRYIAKLGVQFDRARAGQILGISGRIFRSPPLLVLPVVFEAGVPQVFETRSEWQRAWAEFRTADSSIDYVRTAGSGVDLLLLNAGQTRRRSRAWWRDILDTYGASDVLIPMVRIERSWPGGPLVGHFAARYGPDNALIGTFSLTTANPSGLRAMMVEGVKRIDALYVGALAAGRLRTDPSLIIETPVTPSELPPAEDTQVTETDDLAAADAAPAAPAVAAAASFAVQVDTPDAAAVSAVEAAVRALPGVDSAQINSVAIGGVSVMRVQYRGDLAGLRARLAASGWRVSDAGGGLRIAR